ncbi:hypothetical protein GO690_04455 [Staphylococcus aureus]|nr:hypothetical protein [Staphylococcus aureus]MVH10108.1 hypothetical protein [Staphylococcus aureus]
MFTLHIAIKFKINNNTFNITLLFLIISLLVKSRLLCKMLYNVFTISTYQN